MSTRRHVSATVRYKDSRSRLQLPWWTCIFDSESWQPLDRVINRFQVVSFFMLSDLFVHEGYLQFALIVLLPGDIQVKFDPPEHKPWILGTHYLPMLARVCGGWLSGLVYLISITAFSTMHNILHWLWLAFRIGIFDFDHSAYQRCDEQEQVVISFQDWYIWFRSQPYSRTLDPNRGCD